MVNNHINSTYIALLPETLSRVFMWKWSDPDSTPKPSLRHKILHHFLHQQRPHVKSSTGWPPDQFVLTLGEKISPQVSFCCSQEYMVQLPTPWYRTCRTPQRPRVLYLAFSCTTGLQWHVLYFFLYFSNLSIKKRSYSRGVHTCTYMKNPPN